MNDPIVEHIMKTGYPPGITDDDVVAGTCEQCDCYLYEGEEDILKFDGDLFCEEDCLMKYLEVERVEL